MRVSYLEVSDLARSNSSFCSRDGDWIGRWPPAFLFKTLIRACDILDFSFSAFEKRPGRMFVSILQMARQSLVLVSFHYDVSRSAILQYNMMQVCSRHLGPSRPGGGLVDLCRLMQRRHSGLPS